MTSPKEVPLTLRHAGLPPDDIDGLLRAFFRAELPDPWPVLKSPAADENPVAVRKTGRTWSMMRSRLALAASIGLLLIGCWFLSGLGVGRPAPEVGPIPEGTAKRFLLSKEEPEQIIDIDDVKYKLREKVEQPVKPVGQNVKPVGPPTHRYEMVPVPKSGEK